MLIAYKIDTGEFRKITTEIKLSVLSLDENANVMIYDEDTGKVFSSEMKEAVGIKLKLKTFSISAKRFEVVRYVTVTYHSRSPLTLNLYAENSNTVAASKILPANNVVTSYRVELRYRAKKFTLEIIDEVKSTFETEINRIEIEHDGEGV